jgi:hypothetical protein
MTFFVRRFCRRRFELGRVKVFTHFPSSIPFCEEQNRPLSSPAEGAGEDAHHSAEASSFGW